MYISWLKNNVNFVEDGDNSPVIFAKKKKKDSIDGWNDTCLRATKILQKK